jgi:hypothetical protein
MTGITATDRLLAGAAACFVVVCHLHTAYDTDISKAESVVVWGRWEVDCLASDDLECYCYECSFLPVRVTLFR